MLQEEYRNFIAEAKLIRLKNIKLNKNGEIGQIEIKSIHFI